MNNLKCVKIGEHMVGVGLRGKCQDSLTLGRGKMSSADEEDTCSLALGTMAAEGFL